MEKQTRKKDKAQRLAAARRYGRRAVCLVMVAIMFGMVLFYASPYADAASPADGYGKVNIYKWELIKTRDDLPKDNKNEHYLWLTSGGKNTILYLRDQTSDVYALKPGATGGDYDPKDQVQKGHYSLKTEKYVKGEGVWEYFDADAAVFYTPHAYGMIKLTYANVHTDYSYLVKYYMQINAGYDGGWIYDRNTDSYAIGFTGNESDRDPIGICCGADSDKKSSKDYRAELAYGTIGLVYDDDNGWDTLWCIGPRAGAGTEVMIYGWETGTSYNTDEFYGWIGTKYVIQAIVEDYTVDAGDVCNLSNGVWVNDGVTITVKPDAVLSIEGILYNNGKIENYGTVILQEKAAVFPYGPLDSSPSAGQITCYSGTNYKFTTPGCSPTTSYAEGMLVVMKDARLAFWNGKGSLALKGGSLYNYGFVGTHKLTMESGAEITNTGSLLVGYAVKGLTSLPTTVIDVNGSSITMSGGTKYSRLTNTQTMSVGDNIRIINEGVANISVHKSTVDAVKSVVSGSGKGSVESNYKFVPIVK